LDINCENIAGWDWHNDVPAWHPVQRPNAVVRVWQFRSYPACAIIICGYSFSGKDSLRRGGHMNRRSLLAAVPSVALIPVTSSGLFAQTYPFRPIRLIVPSSPGGAHDIIARLWTDRIRSFGAFVVENRSGAGTIIGTAEVGRAVPDGYLLLLGSTNTHILQPLTATIRSYDPLSDFAPISILGTTATAIAVTPSLPVRSVMELIEYARAHPGKIALGHSGPGTNTFLSGELFKQLAGGLDIVSVPYKGAGPSFADLLSGQIQMIIVNVTNQITDFHAGQKIRLLAVNAAARIKSAPDIPTTAEAGLPGMISQTFYATFAPAKTPDNVLMQLDQATQDALGDLDFQGKLVKSGFDPVLGHGPRESVRYIAKEYARWEPIVKKLATQN
jgi:tripartite-type tricarboxylate transporter receptor subunit TctC